MIRYDLTVYIGEAMREKRPVIKCHDTGVTLALRPVVIRKASQYREDVEDYRIPPSTTAILKIRKPDDTYVVCDASVDGGRIICQLPPQSCTDPGVCQSEVQLFDASGKRLTSATFTFEVTKECLCDCEEESKPWVDVLGAQVKTAVDSAADAKKYADAARADADLVTAIAAEVAENAQKTAQDAASTAQVKEAAQEAQRLAERAQQAAEEAKQAAETAQSAAAQSAADADTAKQGAEAAQQSALIAAADAAKALEDIRALLQDVQTWAAGVSETVNTAAERAGDSAAGAANAAAAAQTAQAKAEDARQGAEAARDRTEMAAIRQPYPDAGTGTWWVWDAEHAAYADSGVTAKGQNGESGLPSVVTVSGAEPTMTLANNTETRCADPVTALTIEGFSAGEEGKAEQWGLVFTAGDTITVTVPDTLLWAAAEPVFSPGSTYWLSVVPLGGRYLAAWTEVPDES